MPKFKDSFTNFSFNHKGTRIQSLKRTNSIDDTIKNIIKIKLCFIAPKLVTRVVHTTPN